MTTQEATYFILNKLRAIYEEGEAGTITDWVMEHLTGSKKAERMIYKNAAITGKEEQQLQQIAERLLSHEPVQYVLNESWFCGLKFYVDKNVLIPRPETEELVEWIITNCRFPVDELSILDIGTGSGCIPIALKRRIRKAGVWSCDISDAALRIAKKNAASLGTEVSFHQLDFLDKQSWDSLPSADIIVSNPPYIPEKDKATMQPRVLNHEPATALFVPDNDPLVFYKALAEFGKKHLKPGGSIYTEIHEDLGQAAIMVFRSAGYSTELKKDMQQKDRMLRSGLQ
jgi:release factor glutamine methyltransferase